ncbi:hypothetical protein P4E94_17860 [Pontiellaceae bacterium B12219]|nr:hypothetical protein [Pontiellaceae bacterium B12219]
MMHQRRWPGTNMIEYFDIRQQRMLDLVLEKVRHYYADLYGTRDCYRYPLTISRLMKLCNRSGLRTLMAVRILSHSIDVETEKEPPLVYERDASQHNAMRRPYRIYLRSNPAHRR